MALELLCQLTDEKGRNRLITGILHAEAGNKAAVRQAYRRGLIKQHLRMARMVEQGGLVLRYIGADTGVGIT